MTFVTVETMTLLSSLSRVFPRAKTDMKSLRETPAVTVSDL